MNNASKIGVPLLTSHGETDSRVPVEEAYRMWDIVKQRGIHSELIIGEKEGHGKSFFRNSLPCGSSFCVPQGFKQKSVIEYSNAARIAFLERFLLRTNGSESSL